MSQSLTRVIYGKLIYIAKITDSLTTKVSRLSQDLRIVDRTFSQWQSQLNELSKETACHESMLLEFLSKHSAAVNRAFVALLRLTEIQDVLHQFASLETKTLFGFPNLPPFLHSQILSQLATDMSMQHTAKALDEGFPLFINPMIDIEHNGPYIDASVLLTLPVVPDKDAFCTIEYLSPIKFNVSNICYTGPVTQNNLVLLSCPTSKRILTTESLNKCYQDDTAFLCPTNLLNFATNVTWLGFPFNPDTKLTFPRNHVPADDCANLHPMLPLGGRLFLATTTTELQLSSGRLVTTPLAVYRFPCNETFDGMTSGLGTCPARISVTVPMASPFLLKFTPWAPALANDSGILFSHKTLDIPPPEHLNKSILNALDKTFNAIDGQLTRSLETTNNEIDAITEEPDTTTAYIGYAALAFSLVSCIVNVVLIHLFCQITRHNQRNSAKSASPPVPNTCPGCNRQQSPHCIYYKCNAGT